MLCKFCTAVCQEALRQTEKLRQSGLPPQQQFRHIQHFPGHTWTELEDGCVMNCYTCKRFWNKASDDYKKDARAGGLYPPGNKFSTVTSFTILIKLDRAASSRDPYSQYEISLWLYHSQVAYKSHFVPHIHSCDCQEFIILPSSDLEGLLPQDYDHYQLESESNAKSVAEQTKFWKMRCDERHSKCFKPKRRGQYPTRLLHIKDKNEITLCDSVDVDVSEPYVTLSYTWGDKNTVIKTTDDLLPSRRAGIPWSDLPVTLRDVIEVTRSLGINYIWIDSLCIIQDQSSKVTDFSLEGPFMEEIYSNSIFTIAASVGSNTHVRCFPERIPELLKPAKFDAPNIARGFFYIIDQTLWEASVSGAPLNSRGWVLQERLLSPRTIHLCPEQVFWECSELAACEALPLGLPTKIMEKRGGLTQIPQNGFKGFINECSTPTLASSPRSSQNSHFAYERWCQIVETFSMCKFYDPSDKIVAITGVAKKMNKVFDDKFLAGLWKKRFFEGLAWEVHSGPEVTIRGKKPVHLGHPGQPYYCGPSWSWVSVDGHVKYDLRSSEMTWTSCVNLESCIIEPKDKQFATPEKEGTVLWLQGPLQSVEIYLDNGSVRPHIGNWFIWEEIFLDTTTIQDHVKDNLFVAPILVGTPQNSSKNKHHIGLVLRYLQGSYQRIGLLHAWKDTTAMKAAVLLRNRSVSYNII